MSQNLTIKRTKDLNYFSLCAFNLFYTRASQLQLNYWNKWTFPWHSNWLRCTCIDTSHSCIRTWWRHLFIMFRTICECLHRLLPFTFCLTCIEPDQHDEINVLLKERVHPNTKCLSKMCLHSCLTRCRWICFFIGTDLEKCSITSLAHQCILNSEWVPLEWESKQLIKTSQ